MGAEEFVAPMPGRWQQDTDSVASYLDQYKEWYHGLLARKAVESLEKHGIKAFYVPDRHEALVKIMELIPEGATVGLGDSMTLYQTGVISALNKGDYKFINPWREGVTKEESYELRRQCLLSDVFITGSNAVTLTGELVNTDGLGNRVAAMIFGPRKVIIAAGVNKIVNDVEDGQRRIREIAAPISAKRHDFELPCVKTGRCYDCNAAARVCRVTTIIDRDFGMRWFGESRLHVIIIGEELGL